MIRITHKIFTRLAALFPALKFKLVAAGMPETPEEFVKKSVMLAFYVTGGVSISLLTIISQFGGLGIGALILPIVMVFVLFFYFMRVPDVKIVKIEREINQEIVFAVRFLVIELESGASLYAGMGGIRRNYEIVGKYFGEIVDRIDLGTPLELAIQESIETTYSPNYRKVLWQIINSLNTGADVSASLNSTVDQIATEQLIQVKEYGRKLNPLAMFYMMVAVILPSIGMVMLIMLSSFLSLTLELATLLMFVLFIGFIQFMFFSIIKTQRPAVDL